MKIERFNEASLSQLEIATGICRTRWSRYLSGKMHVSEKTLLTAAQKLEMEPVELLRAIHDRRANKLTLQSS